MNTENPAFKKSDIQQALAITTMLPNDQSKSHKGIRACAFLSTYIFDVFMKIKKTATIQQKEKYNDLEQAYVDIVNDLSHVYRLEVTVDEYQYKCAKLIERNKELEAENTKLLKSLNFE